MASFAFGIPAAAYASSDEAMETGVAPFSPSSGELNQDSHPDPAQAVEG